MTGVASQATIGGTRRTTSKTCDWRVHVSSMTEIMTPIETLYALYKIFFCIIILCVRGCYEDATSLCLDLSTHVIFIASNSAAGLRARGRWYHRARCSMQLIPSISDPRRPVKLE